MEPQHSPNFAKLCQDYISELQREYYAGIKEPIKKEDKILWDISNNKLDNSRTTSEFP